jgi:hypothetical protein
MPPYLLCQPITNCQSTERFLKIRSSFVIVSDPLFQSTMNTTYLSRSVRLAQGSTDIPSRRAISLYFHRNLHRTCQSRWQTLWSFLDNNSTSIPQSINDLYSMDCIGNFTPLPVVNAHIWALTTGRGVKFPIQSHYSLTLCHRISNKFNIQVTWSISMDLLPNLPIFFCILYLLRIYNNAKSIESNDYIDNDFFWHKNASITRAFHNGSTMSTKTIRLLLLLEGYFPWLFTKNVLIITNSYNGERRSKSPELSRLNHYWWPERQFIPNPLNPTMRVVPP